MKEETITSKTMEITDSVDILHFINETFAQNNEEFYAVEIVSFRVEELESDELQIFTLIDNNAIEREFGIVKSLQSSNICNYKVYCKGNCDCGLEGILMGSSGQNYVQCKCNECTMYFEFSSILSFNETKYDFNIREILSEHNPEFIDESNKIVITSIKHQNFQQLNMMFIEYTNEEYLDHFSFAVTHNNESKKGYTVSCIGSCDCRERFYPETCSIECTCDPCEMIIKELK